MYEHTNEDWDKIVYENWDRIKQEVRSQISDVAYNTWIDPLEFNRVEQNVVYVLHPDWTYAMPIDYLKNHFEMEFRTAALRLLHFNCTFTFIQPEDLSKEQLNHYRERLSPKVSSYAEAMANANLNSKYTFESFVEGNSNKFALAAAVAVAEKPTTYNPLFIYGGPGLGKTHLMQAIAHEILQKDPSKNVLYVTSEKFTSELIDAIHNKSNIAFKEKYRSVDVLLIDDIQFIIGKESTQEEFFNTFNHLYENNKQIVISSDKPPKDFTTLEERLSSRFSSGLIADISAPDYETRIAVLRKKGEESGYYSIDDDVFSYIAKNITSNIRELEGALTRVIAYARLNNSKATLEIAEKVLRDMIRQSDDSRQITSTKILNAVADHFGCDPSELISHKRNKDVTIPRQIVMYLCRQLTDLPLKQIGQDLGNRDHTTIRHGCEKIAEEIKSDPNMRDTVETLTKKIRPASE
ncbi:MAG: chromosomal replication initiator protein DnaA [Lachnospiraceae bacterium]|jgi:chromosomal replication initiator protein